MFSTLELSTAIGRARKVVRCCRCWIFKENRGLLWNRRGGQQLSKKRLYEIAKELGKESKEVVTRAKELGFDVKSHASSVDTDVAEKLIKSFAAKKETVKRK